MKTLLIPLALITTPALADLPVVTAVAATETATGWRFDVTITHPDTGWEHYADGWRIEAPDGTVLGTRDLAHPHETEQPFTRSLDGVTLPEGLHQVRVRAHCLRDGWAEDSFELDLR